MTPNTFHNLPFAPLPGNISPVAQSALRAIIVPNYAYQAQMFASTITAYKSWLPMQTPSSTPTEGNDTTRDEAAQADGTSRE